MTGEVRGRALDYTFSIRAPETVAVVLASSLQALSLDGDDADRGELITVAEDGRHGWAIGIDDGGWRAASAGRMLASLLEHINRRAAESLRVEIPLHAAAVRHPAGGVVALVGGSGAGKSTLSAAAIRSGWGFVAEEIAAVNPDGLVVRSFHRPIGLRRGGAAAIGIDYPTVHDYFDDVYPWPVPFDDRWSDDVLIGAALVDRIADSNVTVAGLSHAQALVSLIEHTVVPDSERLSGVFHQLDRLVRLVPVARLVSPGPESGVAALESLVEEWRR